MLVEYIMKLLDPVLQWRARQQFRAGLRKTSFSPAGESLKALGGLISDSRMLGRTWGLVSVLHWLIMLEKSQPPSRKLLTLERLQAWSLLAYSPLEQLYYLGAHKIVPISAKRQGQLSRWSSRLWGVYLVLQFIHLREDTLLLYHREKALKGVVLDREERLEIQKRKDAIRNEVWVNGAYFIQMLHWSLEKGLYKHEIWTHIMGLIAAIASFRGGWNATSRAK